jgi:hypothetical protein
MGLLKSSLWLDEGCQLDTGCCFVNWIIKRTTEFILPFVNKSEKVICCIYSPFTYSDDLITYCHIMTLADLGVCIG